VGKDRRDAVLNGLHAESIFAPVHWRNPPSPREEFPEEHDLSEELISLPCDHRYGKEEMHRIAGVVQRLMV
jgi:dTDP-4-amino-4,6-dideoxygalactose transaminase